MGGRPVFISSGAGWVIVDDLVVGFAVCTFVVVDFDLGPNNKTLGEGGTVMTA